MSDNKNSRRGVGRPGGVGHKGLTVYTGKCDVRLSAEEDSMLNRLAQQNGVTRSDVLRRALKDFYKFNTGREE